VDFFHENLFYSIAAGVLICILSLIGAAGMSAPFAKGYEMTGMNATVVYPILFFTNLVFVVLLRREQIRFRENAPVVRSGILLWFMGINMVLASLTFYTTQKNSSFFFEYILLTVIICLVPNTDVLSYIRNTVINLLTMALVICSLHHQVAWQDLVDIAALHIICGFVNRVRWTSFLRSEAAKFAVEEKKNRFYRKSRTDALTGLLNRFALREDFPDFLDKKICLALMDLDSFKKMNDTYGHSYGDRALEVTGKALKASFPDQSDRCYRYGGDEFMIISTDRNPSLFHYKLEEFQKACGRNKDGIKISVSIGYYSGTPHSEKELRMLVKIADSFLYQAKAKGTGNREGSLSHTESETTRLMSEQMSVLDTLKSIDEAAALFYQKELSGKDWSIAYLNINRFAEMNESLGFREGQIILEKISRIILKYFPDSVLVNREVDHFVLYSTVPDQEFIRRIRVIQAEAAGAEAERMIILRAGIYHHHQTDAPADFIAGMYNAKYASDLANDITRSDRYICVYDAGMSRERTKESFVHNHFSEALEKGFFVPWYQPIVGSLSGTTCGFEALSRWVDPEKGILLPGDYIPYLEKMNEAYSLDLCLLDRVCRDIAGHRDKFPVKLFVNVNLSQTDFQIVHMPEEIEKIVSRYQISKQQLQFEITESAFADKKLIYDAVKELNDLGYRVWMDDFGVGESSLSALGNYRLQGVKLDRSLFADYTNQRTQIIIRSIVNLSHETDSMMIAEGIESWDQLWFARQWGINYIQGFFFSRPMPLEKLLESSFIGNLTDDATDRLYQAAAEANLAIIYHQHYYAQGGRKLLFARAVLEWNQRMYVLRMNEEMQELVRTSVVIEESDCILLERSALAAVLAQAAAKVKEEKKLRDFEVEVKHRKLHGQLSFLAEDAENGKYVFLLNLTNFTVAMPEAASEP
jgi:diguanylate cyclase (GGDEF)-like protein